ncbi:MAG: hypothetical protein ABR905_02210 [Terracidiphilus sp.]|jgi:hypothetical protein
MSIRSRLEDAELLWKSGRLEGAFVLALIAVAATSRRAFPGQKDGEAFENFLNQGWFKRLSVEYLGKVHEMRHIFYKWFRCELIHEGELPIDVEIVPDLKPGSLSVRAGGAPGYVLQVSRGWFHELVVTVIRAEVNRDQFTDHAARA